MKDYEELTKSVEDQLILLVEEKSGKLSEGKKERVRKNFHNFLAKIFTTYGEYCAKVFLGQDKKIKDSPIPLGELIENYYNKLNQDKELINAQRISILELFHRGDEELSYFLYSLSQAYYLIEILHLDPDCQKITKESCQRKIIYLDTNILIHLLMGESKIKHSTEKEIMFAKNLGMKLRVTQRTIEEFMDWILETRGKMEKIEFDKNIQRRFERSKDILENGIVKDFLEKKSNNPSLTIEGYFARLEKIESLLKKYSIKVDKEVELKDTSKLDGVTEFVHRFAIKSEKVAEHDAYHILLIQELRKKDNIDILGCNYWFLTHDSTLRNVDFLLKDHFDFPATIRGEQFIEMISPILAPDISAKDISEVFKHLLSSSLPPLTATIKQEDWLKIQGHWMDDEDLSSEDIIEIIGSSFMRNYLTKIREEKKEEVKAEEIVEIANKVWKHKAENLSKELHKVTQRVSILEEQRKEDTSHIVKIVNILFISIFILVGVIIYFVLEGSYRLGAWSVLISVGLSILAWVDFGKQFKKWLFGNLYQ